MRFRYLLVLLGLALVVMGGVSGGWAWLAAWLGADFVVLGTGYAFGWHRIFGKDSRGCLPAWSRVVFAPLLAYAWSVWHLLRRLGKEPPCSEAAPDLVIGRRLLSREFAGGFENVVDLTAEFAEPLRLRNSGGYVSFPLLDGSAPNPGSLKEAIDRLKSGRTFIHCAQGHGRSALFAAAVLLHRGAVATPEEAVRMMKAARPGVRLNRPQRDCLDAFASLHLGDSAFRGSCLGTNR